MKKRILLRLVSLGITSSILFSCGGQLFAAEVNEPDVWGKAPSEREEKESSDEFEAYEEYEEDYEEFTDVISFEDYVDFDYDSDELAEKYIRSNMNPGRYAYNGSYDFAGGLSKCNATVYNYLLSHIKAIAAGTETSTKITIPDDVLYFKFDYDDMGIDPNDSTMVERQTAIAESLEKAGFDSNEILTVLLGSCPYDLYWFDKVVGVSYTYSSIRGNTYDVFGFTFSFSVANEYQADNIYSVNSSFGQAVTDAAANAKSIISANAGKDDYSKLLAYTDAIRDSVDYNYAAADSSYNGGYGNPWQMIWVFDGDDDTKVVCEGYSKAFQYLCDNTDFDDDDIFAISAYGVVSFASSKSEPHMWNIVHMDDGKNYVVDVTAMDTGDSDSFLKGAKENNGKGALLTNDDYYAYDGDLLSYYDNDVLTIAEADYVYTPASYTVTLNLIKNCDATLSKTSANAGDEVTVTVNPVEGYELDYVEVNGQKIDGTKFSMPSKDVTVNVVCKKIDYTVALSNIIKNCDASLSVATANVGDDVTVTVNPVEGYEFDYIEVNGEKVTDTTFTMPAADVSVSVYCKKIDYTVALGNIIKNCDASLSVATANVGDEVTVNVTPVEGYEFDYIEVNGEKVTDTTFTMPAENVTVNVYCKKTDFAITCEAAQNGTVYTNTDTANVGDDITITVAPADGYVLDSLTVKDAAGKLIDVKDNVFKMPASSVTVSAVFKKIEYTVSLGNLIKNCNPKLSATSACEGDKITVTVNAVGGFELDYIEVNGQQIEGTEFTMPAGNVVVNVFCKKTDFAITCEAAQNGTVKTNTDTANVGDQITITAVPADGYVLDSVTVKDAEGNVIAVKDNEFQMPASAVTVTAVFKKDITPGWMQDGEVWYYILDDGTKATGWLKVGAWYYFDEDGVMLTGWQKIEGIWYYLRASGSMVTGWLDYGNKKYYLKSSGAMAIGWEKINGEWYYFNASGAMTTGWQKVNGLWYYMDASGVMLTGWIFNNGHWYYLKDYGAMATGWVRSGGNWYYMNPATGAMTTGWITVGSYTYYLDEDGKMVTGIVKIDGRRYRFADDGHCLNP